MLGILTRNITWKLLSFGLAILLWMVVVRDPELHTTVPVPVLYRGMPQNLELSGELQDRVQVELRGPASQLTPEDLADAAVVLDLGAVEKPGDRTYTIEPSNVSLPAGVRLSRAVPSQLRLHFERRMSRRVPVRVRFSAGPPDGFEVVSNSVTPDTLAIVGPESNVRLIAFVDTDSIDLSNVFAPAEFSVNVYVADAQVRFEGVPRVTVRVEVARVPH
jgi:YbbR domain-containing protein